MVDVEETDMYARVSRLQGPPDRIDELVSHFTSTSLPAIRALPGYAGSSLAVDKDRGDGQAVTFWESKEALEATEQVATGIRTAATQAGGGTLVSVHRLEIAIMERAGQPTTPAFLRVMRAQGDPSRLDAMIQATREKALPVLRTLSGFRALVVGVDRQSGFGMITGVWDTVADREASNERMQGIRKEIFDISGAQPEIALYEVKAVEFTKVGATSV